jgi:hypothetical protein
MDLLKVAKGIGGTIAVAASSIGIYAWYTQPTERIHMEARLAEFILPPTPKRNASTDIDQLLSTDGRVAQEISQALEIEADSRQASLLRLAVMNLRSEYLRRQAIDLNEFMPTTGLWTLQIQNTGSKAASSVTLRLQRSHLVLVRRPGKQDELLTATNSDSLFGPVTIGSMQPTESIQVLAWTTMAGLFDEPSITHDAGVGTVHVAPRTVSLIAEWLDNYIVFLFVIFMVFLLSMVVVFDKMFNTMKGAKRLREALGRRAADRVQPVPSETKEPEA